MKKWTKISEEVYRTTSDIVKITDKDIDYLKNKLINCEGKRIRICAHHNNEDDLHEMLIVIAKGSYIRPHKHINKVESLHIIDGELDIVIFDDSGRILELIPMGSPLTSKNFFYRMSKPYFHTLLLRSDFVVMHEVTNGPWRKDDTIVAPWSPDSSDYYIVKDFLEMVENNLREANQLLYRD